MLLWLCWWVPGKLTLKWRIAHTRFIRECFGDQPLWKGREGSRIRQRGTRGYNEISQWRPHQPHRQLWELGGPFRVVLRWVEGVRQLYLQVNKSKCHLRWQLSPRILTAECCLLITTFPVAVTINLSVLKGSLGSTSQYPLQSEWAPMSLCLSNHKPGLMTIRSSTSGSCWGIMSSTHTAQFDTLQALEKWPLTVHLKDWMG